MHLTRNAFEYMLTMIIAGHDTTYFTLITTITLFSKNLKVSQKLRKYLSFVETSKNPQLQYLKNVIREIMRLIPVGDPGPAFQTGRDISCKEGLMIIRKVTNCFVPIILAHRKNLSSRIHMFSIQRCGKYQMSRCMKHSCYFLLEKATVLDSLWW